MTTISVPQEKLQRRTDFSSLEAKQVENARRHDPVFRAVFDRVELLEDIVAGLAVEVTRDKTLPEQLRGWLKDKMKSS